MTIIETDFRGPRGATGQEGPTGMVGNQCDTGAAGLPGPTDFVVKTHTSEVEDFEFILSDESVDRMGDIIMLDGWKLAAFKRNPIALFGHSSAFPIGTWKNIRIEGDALRARLEMAPEGTSARIDEIRRLVAAKILRATSVGFRPIKYEPLDAENPWDGYRFIEQE